jgi:hypothetical protein
MIMSMKNSSDTIGNRTRDLPACSAVPQPTAPPAACFPFTLNTMNKLTDVGRRPLLYLSVKLGLSHEDSKSGSGCFEFMAMTNTFGPKWREVRDVLKIS